jgi:hypothetical protein
MLTNCPRAESRMCRRSWLAGLCITAPFDWWWADPVAALGSVFIVAVQPDTEVKVRLIFRSASVASSMGTLSNFYPAAATPHQH